MQRAYRMSLAQRGWLLAGAVVLVLCARGSAAAQAQVLVEVGDEWKYFKGTEAPPADWSTLGFLDDGWLQGPTGIGYGDGDDATVLGDMQNGYMAFFARREFTVSDPASVERLTLSIIYDDGFVAYINGSEVARADIGNPGEAVAFDATATSHEAGTTPTLIDLDLATAGLGAGTNVLAIEVHNTNLGSSDASMIPRLVSNGVFPPANLTCPRTGTSVALTWTDPDTYDAIRVLRNGTVIANLPGTDATYTDTAFDGLDTEYQVIATAGGLDAPSGICRVGCSSVTLTCTLAIVGGKTQATLSWGTAPAGTTSIEILREGGALATADPATTTYTDPDVESLQPEDDTDYTVIFHQGATRTCTVTCGPITLCVQNLTAAVAGNTVALSWGNVVKAWDHYEISRDGTVVDAAVPGSAATWTDTGLVLQVGDSHDYTLHPVAVAGGELPDPGTQCDLTVQMSYAPEIGRYEAPPGGWDYELKFASTSKPQYSATEGEKGNIDGNWIRAIGRDDWDGSAPLEVGAAPGGPAPGGADVVARDGLGACGSNTFALRILDPGDPGNPDVNQLGSAYPDPFNAPNNKRIFLGYDTQVTTGSLLKTGVTFSARVRLSPDAPAYMLPTAASGDGDGVHNGTGHVGVYFRDLAASPPAGFGAAFALNSNVNGGNLEFSSDPMTDVDGIGTKKFIAIWMTVKEGTTPDTYDVNLYLNGSTTPDREVGGAGIALQAVNDVNGNFGPNVANYLAIGSDDTGADAMVEIDYVAYKAGVFAPTVSPCGGGGDTFRRGDSNGDGGVNITDGIYTLNFLFLGGPEPGCLDSADANDDGGVNITDGIYVLNFLFLGGPNPAPPGPTACGPDPTPGDQLTKCTNSGC